MKRVDAIDKYLEAKSCGDSEEKAQLFARSWAESCELHVYAATKGDFQSLKLSTKADFQLMQKDLLFIKILGAAIFAVFCLPILERMIK